MPGLAGDWTHEKLDALAKKDGRKCQRAANLLPEKRNDGPTFRAMRHGLLMSQARLGIILGVDRKTISLWERGLIPIPNTIATLVQQMVLEWARTPGQSETMDRLVFMNVMDENAKATE